MQNRCRECQAWTPDESGRFGTCASIAKRKGVTDSDTDELIFTCRSKVALVLSVKTGCGFGCIRWRPKLDPTTSIAGKPDITADELRGVMSRNNMKPADLARCLDVRVQRVSEWQRGYRKVPKMAVTLMKCKGLL